MQFHNDEWYFELEDLLNNNREVVAPESLETTRKEWEDEQNINGF